MTKLLVPVTEPSQVGDARRRASALALNLGFDETRTGQIAIVASELATNLLKHTRAGGMLIVQPLRTPHSGMEILSLNHGAGMSSVAQALVDGYSTKGTLGTGLGAMRRLSDQFDIFSQHDFGTIVVARFINEKEQLTKPLLNFSAISMPQRSEIVCGDSWCYMETGAGIFVMVADGLGHGPQAAEASEKATEILKANAPGSVCDLLRAMHKGLKHTRGAAVSLAQIDLHNKRLNFAGLGNVSANLITAHRKEHLTTTNGTAGFEARTIREYSSIWTNDSILILHSDGCSNRWSIDNYPGIESRSASVICAAIYKDFSKNHDDATVVVVKSHSRI